MNDQRLLTREQIAKRIEQDIPDGSIVNLGIGIPVLISNYVNPDKEIVYHSEQGLLGMGPLAKPGEEDPDLVNAAKVPVTLVTGGSFFHSADSFAMPRGGHLDIAVLGGMQVSEQGDLANWKVKDSVNGNIGGAMDIAVGARKVFVAMTHYNKTGESKIVRQLDYPVTALRCVDRIYTDMAVIDVTDHGLELVEIAPGFSVEEVQAKTEPKLLISDKLTTIAV